MESPCRNGSVQPLLSIRHLISQSLEKDQNSKQNNARSGTPLRWRRCLRCLPRHVSHKDSHVITTTAPTDSDDDADNHVIEADDEDASSWDDTSSDDGLGQEPSSKRKFIVERFLPAAKALASKTAVTQKATPPKGVQLSDRDKVSQTWLPKQSRPILLRSSANAYGDEDDDVEEDFAGNRFRMACVGLLSQRLRNMFGHVSSSPTRKRFSVRRKITPRQPPPYRHPSDDLDDDDSSSGLENERAVIEATKKKASAAVSPVHTNHRSAVDLVACRLPRKHSPQEFPSPDIGRALQKRILHSNTDSCLRFPALKPPRVSFLGFPRDHVDQGSARPAAESGKAPVKATERGYDSDGSSEEWYSGKSSPLPEVLEGSHDSDVEGIGVGGISPVSVLLPPPLPKSPSESWLCRALPSISTKSATKAVIAGHVRSPFAAEHRA